MYLNSIILIEIITNILESSKVLVKYLLKRCSEIYKICECKTKSHIYDFRVELHSIAGYQAKLILGSMDHYYGYFLPDEKWTAWPDKDYPLSYFHVQE